MVILVVEDESLINLTVSEELQRAGHVVTSAYDADQAIAILEGPKRYPSSLHRHRHARRYVDGLSAVRRSALSVAAYANHSCLWQASRGASAGRLAFPSQPYRIDELGRTVEALS